MKMDDPERLYRLEDRLDRLECVVVGGCGGGGLNPVVAKKLGDLAVECAQRHIEPV